LRVVDDAFRLHLLDVANPLVETVLQVGIDGPDLNLLLDDRNSRFGAGEQLFRFIALVEDKEHGNRHRDQERDQPGYCSVSKTSMCGRRHRRSSRFASRSVCAARLRIFAPQSR
jgi:hypothetical protein